MTQAKHLGQTQTPQSARVISPVAAMYTYSGSISSSPYFPGYTSLVFHSSISARRGA